MRRLLILGISTIFFLSVFLVCFIPDVFREPAEKQQNLSIEVAILYERIGDGKIINRSVEDEIKIFKETKADFIFRAFWLWEPCYERCEDAPYPYLHERGKFICGKLLKADHERCKDPSYLYELGRRSCDFVGYSYSHLDETISKIKSEIPNVIICGAIGPEVLPKNYVYDPKTKEVINYPETWEMALDPSKWGINVSKERFQCWYARYHNWVPQDYDCENFDPRDSWAYFPDITNKKFQELFLHWIERQIDAGVDAMWIDMLYTQAYFLYKMTKDIDHPAVKESHNAALEIIEKIREYGEEKGKYIFIGTWAPRNCVAPDKTFQYYFPDLDFVTITPLPNEVREMKLNETLWDNALKCIREKYENVPIMAFLDWGPTTKLPIGIFSQNLTKEQQKEFLKIVDEFFSKRNVIFAYPVHGGFMGHEATTRSFGFYPFYDSLAPEFETYETIKELIRKDEK